MQIIKKIKCKHCGEIIEGENVKCTCGKVIIVENTIPPVAIVGIDYEDLTPKLLNG